jgi:hypothetical protein
VAEAVSLIEFPITEEQAIERLIELDQREARTSFEVALEMGTIVLQFVRPSNATDPKGTLQRLSERSGVSLSTLRTRGLVCERLPDGVRAHPNFRNNSFTVYEQIALCPDPVRRAELFDIVLNEPPPPGATRGHWRVNDIRAMLGRALATSFTIGSTDLASASVEERRQALLDLMADRDVLVPLVNDRDGQPAGLSQIEQAFFEARAPYVLETVQMLEEARRESKHIQEQAALGAPGLQNMQFIGKTRARIESDAVRYSAFANDLRSDALQDLGDFLSQLRAPLDILAAAIERCRAALPDAENAASPDDLVIDAQARAVLERLALPSTDLRQQGHSQDVDVDGDAAAAD